MKRVLLDLRWPALVMLGACILGITVVTMPLMLFPITVAAWYAWDALHRQ